MTPLARHMAVYAAYHRDPRNRLTHFIGVPAIAFAILIPMAWARTDIAGVTLSLAMLFTAAVLVVYPWYDRTLALAAMCAFAPLLFYCRAGGGAHAFHGMDRVRRLFRRRLGVPVGGTCLRRPAAGTGRQHPADFHRTPVPDRRDLRRSGIEDGASPPSGGGPGEPLGRPRVSRALAIPLGEDARGA